MSPRSFALRLATAAALASLATGALAQDAKSLAVRTDGLSPFVARSVEEKAAQGVGELRRYVERTRMIHGLYLPDLVRGEEAALEQAATAPAADAPVVARQQAVPATRMAAARAPRTQVAGNAKSASPLVTASAKPAARAKGAAAKGATDTKLALTGHKTKRA